MKGTVITAGSNKWLSLGLLLMNSLTGCLDAAPDESIGSVDGALSLEPTGDPAGYGAIVGVSGNPDGILKCLKSDRGPWNSTEGGLIEFYVDGEFFTSVEYAPQPKQGGTLYEVLANKSVFTMVQGGKHTAQCIAYPYEDGLLGSPSLGFESCGAYACARSKVWGFRVMDVSKKPGYCKDGFPGKGNGVRDNIAENCGSRPSTVYEKILDVPHYSQDQPCWCSVTIVEMWSDYLNGSEWRASHQSDLAAEYGIPSTRCPNTGDGMNVHELAAAVEAETSHWMKRDKTASEEAFARTIVEQVNDGKPVAVVGYTRYKHKDHAANQHWYLVRGFRNTTEKFSASLSNIDCFYVHDSVHGSDIDYIYSTSPDVCVGTEQFFDEFLSKSNGQYYLVREKNGIFDN
ncbi:C39 family peptidase [Sorangium sp. So ce145]|uniref:C39 family peptidase n=1 Tax=Sorangium sp. So ce145 TaxID=3133285 RepID=UPI003F63248A